MHSSLPIGVILYAALLLASFAAPKLSAQTAVWTAHYGNERTGANTNETTLTPQNVNSSNFGRLARLPVEGCVFAQPLFVPGVITGDGAPHDIVFLATATNNLYAYDANSYNLYYTTNFGLPVPSTDFLPSRGYHDFSDCVAGDGDGPIGIVGTPVIDVADNAMYFVANTVDTVDSPHKHSHFLHKVSLSTGQDVVPPVHIEGSYAGVDFDSRYQLQRAALLLTSGRLYVAFSSHQDETPYYGWLFAYDTALQQTAVINYSPTKSGAGIWQSGGGPATDGYHIYFNTGNLAEDESHPDDNSDSILKINPVTLEVESKLSFYPESNDWDANYDLDLGSSRAILIPGTGQVISGSKFGDLFLVDRDGMRLRARLQASARHSSGFDWSGVYNGFAYWNNMVYVWPSGGGFVNGYDPPFPTDTLKGFSVDSSSSTIALRADGQSDGIGAGYQGANIVVSANGTDPSTGIVWAHVPSGNTSGLEYGFLHAYNASSFANGIFEELWNNIDAAHPEYSTYMAKFNQPLIANGKVFLPTLSNAVIVYGLLPNRPKNISASPGRPRPTPHR